MLLQTVPRRLAAGVLAAVVGLSLMSVTPPAEAVAQESDPPPVQNMKSVPVSKVEMKDGVKAGSSKALKFEPTRMPKRAGAKAAPLGRGWTEPIGGLSVRTKSRAAGDESVSITSLGQVAPAGVTGPGPVFEVGQEGDGDAQSVPLQVRLDYSSFADAIGGDWAGRLRLVMLDECTTKKSGVVCDRAAPLATTVDRSSQTLTASIPAADDASSQVTIAASAAPSGSQGDYTASPMTPSSTWSAVQQSGDFTWSYPLAVPPAVAGPAPDLAVNYSSGAVDGRSSATNGQTSWVGEGFSLDPGFVERSYEPCRDVADDSGSNAPSGSGDLCWRNDNLTISFNGSSAKLIRDGATGQWRMKSDDGSRIERLTSNGINDDDNGEYWRLTSTDGTRYYFGRNERFDGDARKTDSVSTVPVYGSKSGQPCHDSSFGGSVCDQAWRWGLDYVVDPHGNSMSYFYGQETNKYGSNKNATVREYDRASVLKSIEYGTRAGSEDDNPPPAKVEFTVAERCISESFDCTSDLTEDNASNWPEVPFDQICKSSSSCSDRIAPTFFSRKRLVKVATFAGGDAVNQWNLTQQLPATGDMLSDPDLDSRTVRTLWLAQIQQVGKAGADIALPPVKFTKRIMDNRVFDTDGLDAFRRYRVSAIDNGTGGSIAVNYSPRDCSDSSKPSASELDSNARRCFPVWFQPWWTESRQLEFFHKYRVDSVVESDNTGGALTKATTYSYGGGDGWHYDDSNLEKSKYRTWNDWRGYSTVTTEVGTGSNTTYASSFYLRGMHGDKKQGGGTTSVTAVDPTGDSPDIVDKDERAGFERRTRIRLGASGDIVDIAVNTPWTSPATATQGDDSAYILRTSVAEKKIRISSPAGYRTTRVTTAFNDRGQPTSEADAGDVAIASDDRCTKTTYATNTADGMFDFPATATTTAGSCAAPPVGADDVISATRISYDGGAPGEAPSRGDVTKSESAATWSGGIQYQTDAVSTYDGYGRVRTVKDADGKITQTEYSPSTGAVDTITATNPLGQVATVKQNAAWGSPMRTTDAGGGVTEYAYDSLGRVTSAWAPGRDKAAGDSASVKYSYSVSVTAPGAVTTETLNAASDYVKTVSLYDGLMRERETQTPSPGTGAGRLITEKLYDDRGLVYSDRGPYFNSSAVSSSLVTAAENAIPSYKNLTYDRAGRVTKESLASLGGIKWSTSTSYGGDRTMVTPPAGGTATTTVTDARGQTTNLMQHTGASPTGAADVTTYGYSKRGELASITDSSGTKWQKKYDIRGRLVLDEDPDKGDTAYSYDALDREVSSTDARGFTLWTGYDAIGRKRELRDDNASGLLRSSWNYDTVRPGSLTSSTRYVDGEEYTNEVTAYDAAGRPTSSRVLVPESEGLLHRTGGHVTGTSYNPDGSVKKVTQPLVYGITNEDVTYTYDAFGNVKKMFGLTGIVTDVVYSPLGEVLQRTLGSSNKSVYDSREYDDSTRRNTRRWASLQGTATAPRFDLRYTFDQAGNVTRLNDVAAGDTSLTTAATLRQCFTYDYLRRMTSAWTSSGTTCAAPTTANLGSLAPYWDAFTYAKNGNRTKLVSTRKPGASLVTTIHTSAFPGATAERPHAVSSIVKSGGATGTETFAYDASGSTSKRSTAAVVGKSIEWDREGRQKSVTDLASGKTVSYLYDADGVRLLERNGVDGSATLFLGGTQVRIKDGVRSTVRTYSLGGEAVATRDSSGLKLSATDHQGTPLLSVDSVSQAFSKRRFTPFGEALVSPSSWPSSRGFLNKIVDVGSGTTHLDAREYLPGAGRFLSVDPVLDPMDPQQMNGYAYASNDPVGKSDPGGMYATAGGGQAGPGAYMATDRFGHQRMTKIAANPAGNVYAVRRSDLVRTGSGGSFLGGLASSVAGVADLALAVAGVRPGFQSTFKTPVQDFTDKLTGADRGSLNYQRGEVLGLFTGLLGIGGAGKVATGAARGTTKTVGTKSKPRVKDERGSIGVPGPRGYQPAGGAAEFDLDELAELARSHAGVDDLTRPGLAEIRRTLSKGAPTPLKGQNAVQLDYRGTRVIVNEDVPWRSTAYYPGQ